MTQNVTQNSECERWLRYTTGMGVLQSLVYTREPMIGMPFVPAEVSVRWARRLTLDALCHQCVFRNDSVLFRGASAL